MISLSGDSILLRSGDGELHPQQLDGLREEVLEALALTGRPDSAVADDLMRVVRHFAATAVRSGRLLDGDEVRSLVIRALQDAGYQEAGALMQGVDPVLALRDSLVPAAPREIAGLLAEDARLVGLDRQALAARTAAALTAAGLTRITPAGAVEVALSLALQDADAPEADVIETGYWLLNGEGWGALLTDTLTPAIEDGRLRLYPVSRLAPVVEIVIDLRRFADADTELAILPVLDTILAELAGVLKDLPAILARSCRDVVPDVVSGRLRLVGAESVAVGQLKLSGVHLYSFLNDLRRRASDRLAALPWMAVEPCGQSVVTRGNQKASE